MDSLLGRLCHHPALSHPPKLSSDIFLTLFECIFEHPVFVRWVEEHVSWQLCCVGGPGIGKTTLAAILNKRLKDRFQSAASPVISIFVRRDDIVNENEFLECLINTVYRDLGEEDHSKKSFEAYLEARSGEDEGCSIDQRIALLWDALRQRLRSRAKGSRVFLVVDGLDLCSRSLSALLQIKLLELGSAGVSVFVTTRIPVVGKILSRCDHPKHTRPAEQMSEKEEDDEDENDEDGEDEEPWGEYDRQNEDMFYTCEQCHSILCLPCQAKGRTCASELCTTKGPMRELYDRVDISLSIPQDAMEAYIAWNLEREHGELGLNSSARKPPLSSLGLSIRKNKDPDLARSIVKWVRGLAIDHIGIAKARLDFIHDTSSADEVVRKRYELPANIVAIFNAAVKAVETEGLLDRSLGIYAIAAVGRDSDGISTSSLRKLLDKSSGIKFDTEEDVLRASRGLLTTLPAFQGEEQEIFMSVDPFVNYVVERYNKSIHLADLRLAQTDPIEDITFDSTSQILAEEPNSVMGSGSHMGSPKEPDAPQFVPYIVRKGTRAWT